MTWTSRFSSRCSRSKKAIGMIFSDRLATMDSEEYIANVVNVRLSPDSDVRRRPFGGAFGGPSPHKRSIRPLDGWFALVLIGQFA